MRVEKIEKIETSKRDIASRNKREAIFISKPKKDIFEYSIRHYIEIAKVSPMDSKALAVLAKINLGNDLGELLKEVLKSENT